MLRSRYDLMEIRPYGFSWFSKRNVLVMRLYLKMFFQIITCYASRRLSSMITAKSGNTDLLVYFLIHFLILLFRINLKVSCVMDFTVFPMDVQKCPLIVESCKLISL